MFNEQFYCILQLALLHKYKALNLIIIFLEQLKTVF